MDQQLLSELLDKIRPLAQAAGKAILQIASEDIGVTEKSDGSPLTRADLASHQTIQAGLSEIEPEFPILSEEGDLDNIGDQEWGTYWCVDPLDGTKEFVKGLTDYTVNIALVKDNKPILGVIDIPAAGVTYLAAEGLGAWKIAGDTPAVQITTSKCAKPVSAVVSRSHLDTETEQFLEKLGITNAIPHGSSLKICAVADGTADIYPRFGPTCLWDTAAGAAIAIEAGCVVVDLSGDNLIYDPSRNIKHAGFIVSPAGLELPLAGK
ncbi:MAG: 3'(2'),5'-bisphosphate nucleotidase CysQ [bacterium]|nr:3'(2'),5'-bisphosphate nucleotidase CysQ [bacterium]